MEIIDLLPAIVAGAIWGWIWFRTFREGGYARPGWLTMLVMVPLTAVPTLVWFTFREIQAHRRAARVAAGPATPDESGRMLGSAPAPEVKSDAEAIRRKPVLANGPRDLAFQTPLNLTKLEYRVWRLPELHPEEEIVQMKGQMSVADFHFRLNAQGSGIHPLSIATKIQWTGEAECSFTIEAPAPEEALSSAWKTAAELIDLRTVLATKAH
jgi:hypothetical protein